MIHIFCNAGMSSSMVENFLQKEAKNRNLDYTIRANDISKSAKVVSEGDIIVLGPQIGHMLKKMQANFPGNPIILLTMQEFGSMDGKVILDRILGDLDAK